MARDEETLLDLGSLSDGEDHSHGPEKNAMSYIVALIDGGDLISSPALLEQGEEGGGIAAERLHSVIKAHMAKTCPKTQSDATIIVRVYASISELARKSSSEELLESLAKAESFIRGFNKHDHHFDIVNITSGDSVVENRINVLLQFHAKDSHCVQIILGVDRGDNVKELRDLASRCQSPKIYFLEDIVDADKPDERHTTPRSIRFGDILKEREATPISSNRRPEAQIGFSLIDMQSTSSSSTPEASEVMAGAEATDHILLSPLRQNSPQSIPDTGDNAQRQSEVNSSSSTIPRNIYGQRIDVIIALSPTEISRMRGLHLCRNHFLRRDCPYDDECSFAHKMSPDEGGLPDGSLTDEDHEILAQLTRFTPCHWGTRCDDLDCIYGHHCTAHSVSGKCRRGTGCIFPNDMHLTDFEVANME